ncbi:MAG: prepilin-type N-terminal cleavage/methylation domain-containing protein [Candidatus Omnitrophica bacterium]|nr:prepilin-type N-terminal cleavage/methylation domain-containing protein [Candidatus Omnitrophota bacterium]
MNPRLKLAVTLIELLIAIALIAVVAIGLSSIDIFSHYHVVSSDRRARLQNEVSYILEHMSKQVTQAIGDINQPAISFTGNAGGEQTMMIWIDYNQNGRRDAYPLDRLIAYRFTGLTGNPPYQIRYCPECTDLMKCKTCNPSWPTTEILGQRITNFQFSYPSSDYNYVGVDIVACWDPTNLATCGNQDNPRVEMRTCIKMPAVSTH